MKKFYSLLKIMSFITLCSFNSQLISQNQPLHLQNEVNVINALLNENWQGVYDLLKEVDINNASPVSRLIKAHACLATNRNNESLRLYRSIELTDSLTIKKNYSDWHLWTSDLVKKYPQSSVALYLYGDSYARLMDWNNALSMFKKADSINPNNPIIFNAMGTIYSALNDGNNAIKYFDNSIKNGKTLAEPYISRATYNLKHSSGKEGVYNKMKESLKHSSNSILALNGIGCYYYINCEWDSAQYYFNKIHELDTIFNDIVLFNLNMVIISKQEYIFKDSNMVAQIAPGTDFRPYLQNVNQIKQQVSQTQQGATNLNNYNKLAQIVTPSQVTMGGEFSSTKGIRLYGEAKWNNMPQQYDNNIQTTNSQIEACKNAKSNLDVLENRINYDMQNNPGGVKTYNTPCKDEDNWLIGCFYGLYYNIK